MVNIGYNGIGFNYGFLIKKVPQNILDDLKPIVDKLLDNFDSGEKYNWNLAGEIKHEYELKPTPLLETYVEKLCRELDGETQYINRNYPNVESLEFNSLWVNFQQKYEYNPFHFHEGVFSFVIWYQIPYTFEDERKYSSKTNSQDILHGEFNFMVPDSFAHFTNIKALNIGVDNSKEGYIAVFPSNLSHCVYPFYSSDDFRISISGNILNI